MTLICRTCLTVIKNNYYSLDTLFTDLSDYPQLKDRCTLCIPELDFNSTIDAVLCNTCYNSIDSVFYFKIKCLQTETFINDLIQRANFNNYPIDLFNLIETNAKNLNNEDSRFEVVNTESTIIDVIETTVVDDSEQFYECSPCSYTTDNERSFKKHLNTHNVDNPKYQCSKCKYNTHQKRYFQQHMKIHNSKSCFKCKICDYKCAYKDRFKQHIRVHTGEKPYKCCSCSKRFSIKSNLRIHMNVHTDIKRFKCNTCSYSTAYSSCYKDHLKIHSNEKPYKCNQCNYSARQKYLLRAHMNIHMGLKPYKCDQCDCSYVHHGSLIIHRRAHAGVKTFMCNVCDKSFLQKYRLVRHLNSHNTEKSYKCSECDFKATQAVSLKNHIISNHLTHSRLIYGKRNICGPIYSINSEDIEKIFSCNECEYVTHNSKNLQRHMRIHMSDNPHVCMFCQCKFRHWLGLVKHLKTHPEYDLRNVESGAVEAQCNKAK